jgi:UDP-2,4-diacetamido-2,4,6-trideoxy-beta-L-altropyranose hydrolase
VLATVGRTAAVPAGTLRLRPAGLPDAGTVLQWRNDPDAVRQSGTGRPADSAEHERWFLARLDDPAARIWIAEVDGAAVGYVRIDVRAAVGTVSIAVDAGLRGRGTGTAMLIALLQRLDGDFQIETLKALVQPDNAASLGAFRAAGFRSAGRRGPLLVLQWARMGRTRRESAS